MYLQMNGTTDKLQTPSVTFDEVVLDMQAEQVGGVENYYLYVLPGSGTQVRRITSGTDRWGSYWSQFFRDGVLQSYNTVVFPNNTRASMRCLTTNSNNTGVVTIFSHDNGYGRTKGRIYSVKLLNQGVLVAHYDMSTGTVADQSGNGNDATLTGGTWVSGSTGRPVSYNYDSEQILYADQTTNYDVSQQLYEDLTQSFDTKLSLYQATQQSYTAEQIIYRTVNVLYDTMQEIYSDSAQRTYNYGLHISIYADRTQVYDTRQESYKNTSNQYNLEQAIYKATQSNQDVNIILYADRKEIADTTQVIYTEREYIYSTEQSLYDPDKSLISTIKLNGERTLRIYLQGEIKKEYLKAERELYVKLKGVMQ